MPVLSDVKHLIPRYVFFSHSCCMCKPKTSLIISLSSINSHSAHCVLSLCAPGHLLGLSHDDSKFCEERFGVNSDKRLMSSILTSIDASKPWSRCTSATITDFFDDGNGECRRKCRTMKAREKEGIHVNICNSFHSENFSQPVGVLFSPSTNCIHVNLTYDSFSPTVPITESCLLPNKHSLNGELFTIPLTS